MFIGVSAGDTNEIESGSKKLKLRIVLVIETLQTGGAETFVLRLANALHRRGERISLYVLRRDLIDAALVRSIAPGIEIATASIPCTPWLWRLDGIFYRLGLGVSCLRALQVRKFRSFLRAVGAHLVHSNLFNTDLIAARATKDLGIPWVATMHGDYLAYYQAGYNHPARLHDFKKAVLAIEETVSRIVCITDDQMCSLSLSLPSLVAKHRIVKIHNGYAASPVVGDDLLPAPLSGIHPDAFVIGMVARGVRGKGWEVLIEAFLALNLPDSWLVLVGDGQYLREAQERLEHPRIVFCGNVVDPLRYISRFDVACLPSLYRTESLPTVVMEYLYLDKPVIASDVGELSLMLNASTARPAGIVIKLGAIEAMVGEMKAALALVYSDADRRTMFSANAAYALSRFDMDRCIDAYLSVYRAVSTPALTPLPEGLADGGVTASPVLVSFALLAYNQEAFIRKAVDAALAQDYQPLEIIFSDDCSSDQTFAIMQEIVAGYTGPHRIVLNRNAINLGAGGIGRHVNHVFGLAQGAVLVFAAGDDISLPHRTTTLMAAWSAAGKPSGSIHSAVETLSDDASNNGVVITGRANFDTLSLAQAVEIGMKGILGASHAMTMDLVSRFGPLPPNILFDDRTLAFRSFLAGEIVYCPEVLVLYRRHGEAVSGCEIYCDKTRWYRWIDGTKAQFESFYTDYTIFSFGHVMDSVVLTAIEHGLQRAERSRALVSDRPWSRVLAAFHYSNDFAFLDRVAFVIQRTGVQGTFAYRFLSLGWKSLQQLKQNITKL